MGKVQKKDVRFKIRGSDAQISLVLHLLLSLVLAFVLSGCGVFEGELFGKKFGGPAQDNDNIADIESADGSSGNDDNGNILIEEETGEPEIEDASEDSKTADKNQTELTLEELRFNFSEAMKHFGNGSYVIAEYYLNRVENKYPVLQDHILYYKAKSLLMQEKYGQSEEYYNKVVSDFPDSIWTEKAMLETADLYYLQEDYISAEKKYSDFLSSYPVSGFIPYARYQMAVCLTNNGKTADSFSIFKKIWLEHPSSEYSSLAYQGIQAFEDSGIIVKFEPSAEELFKRGENLFYSYDYRDAITA